MRGSVSVRAEEAQKSTPAPEIAIKSRTHSRVGPYSVPS
jgi:hypothetical protein